jgi:hypothetical protein
MSLSSTTSPDAISTRTHSLAHPSSQSMNLTRRNPRVTAGPTVSRRGLKGQQDIDFQKQTATDIAERVDFPQHREAMIADAIALFKCPIPGCKVDFGPVVKLSQFYAHLEDALYWAYFDTHGAVTCKFGRGRAFINPMSFSRRIRNRRCTAILSPPVPSETDELHETDENMRQTRHTIAQSAALHSTLVSWPSRTSLLQKTWHLEPSVPLESSCRRMSYVCSTKDYSDNAPTSGYPSQTSFHCSLLLVFSRPFVDSRLTHRRAKQCLSGDRVVTSAQNSCGPIAIHISPPPDVWQTR